MIYSKIIGTGSYLPAKTLTNYDLEKIVDTTHDWIFTRSGIVERHVAAAEECTSDLALYASQRAIEAAGITPDEIDLIIVATTSPDQLFPSTALVVGAEVLSRMLDWNDRTTCVLFGDGAGAVVLRASDEPGIIAGKLHADGRHRDMLKAAGQVQSGEVVGDPFIKMDGQAVFKFAVKVLSDVVEEVLEDQNFSSSDINWLVPHQANIRIIEATAKKLGLSRDNVVVTVAKHGNTSAASIPLALDTAVRDGRIQTGQNILIEAVGGGFTWGAVLIKW